MLRVRHERTDFVIAAVVILAIAVAMTALRQASNGLFTHLTITDIGVLTTMLLLVTAMDLVRVALHQSKFSVTFSVSGAVYLAASIGYGAIAGVIVAAIGTIAGEMIAHRTFRKKLFNVGMYICTAGVAGLTYHAIMGPGYHAPLGSFVAILVALLAAALDLFLNAALVSLVIGIDIGKSPAIVFAANVPGLLLQNVTLFSIALLLASIRYFSPFAPLIALLPLLGPYAAMRGHRDTVIQIQKTIEALADTVDRRDLTTAQHSERVAIYTQQIIDELGTIGFAESEAIILAARVHDLGKIAIPDAVLLKPGKLDEGEYWLMRQHPIAGDDILRQLAIYKDSLGVVRHHHERYDGGGYPDGIKGEEIPLGARIVAVADSYDVMTSDRPYARARTVREAKEELIWCKGTHFDPRIVDAFVHVLEREHASEMPQPVTPVSSAVSSPVT